LLNTDYTVVPGVHKRVPAVHDRHGDSALLAELLVEGVDDRYVIIVESQTDPGPDAEYR
jgi:hypothetical protein